MKTLALEAPPRRKLSQIHLADERAVERILEAFAASTDDCVVEAGPGTGVLTDHLVKKVRRLILCEKDAGLAESLRRRYHLMKNVSVLERDFLALDFAAVLGDEKPGSARLLSNLPYHIVSAALEKILEARRFLRDAMVMIQREVADRVLNRRVSTRGYMGFRTAFYCEARSVLKLPPSAYAPQPKVHSEVLHLVFRREPAFTVPDEALLWKAVGAGFRERRRTLGNNLRHHLHVPAEALERAMTAAGLGPGARAEELDLRQWITLAGELAGGKENS